MYQNNYPYTAPVPQPVQNYSLQETAARNLQYIKEFCRRPQVLILAILFSASFVMTIVSGFVTADNMSRELAAMLDIRRYSDYQAFTNGYTIALILSAIPSALIVAALWIIHLRSRSNNPSANPMAGFTIIRVLAIIELVLVCVGGLLMFVVLGILTTIPDETGYATAVMSISFGVVIIVIGVLLLSVFSQLIFAGSFKKSLLSPFLLSKGSVLFGVMMILSALASLSSLTSTPVSSQIMQNGYYYSSDMVANPPVVMITNLLKAAFAVCAAVCAFSYNGYVKHVNMQVQSGYPQNNVPPYMGDPSQASPYQGYNNQQGYNNPYYQQPGYYPYQQQTDDTNPYQQPQSTAQDYPNPYQQPQTPEQDNATPYQQPSQPDTQQQAPEVPPVSETQETTGSQAPVEETDMPQDTVADTGRRTCPVCGEQVGPGVEECPRCGMKL